MTAIQIFGLISITVLCVVGLVTYTYIFVEWIRLIKKRNKKGVE